MSGNEKEALTPGSEGEPRISKVQRTRKQRCLRALYNPDNAKICGRTWKSWLCLWSYYIFVYCLVGALFACLIIGDHKLRDKNKPEHNIYVFQPFLQEPGMIAYPKGDDKHLPEINVKQTDANIKGIQEFLEGHHKDFDIQECGKGNDKKTCLMRTDEATLGPCSPDVDAAFGYSSTPPEPCVLLTLNKIWGWMPKLYQDPPSSMSPGANFSKNSMPVTCESWNKFAEKPTKGKFVEANVYPSTGFSENCFPFCGKEQDYFQPFVMVKFKGLDTEEIGVLCVLYAQNIKDSRETQNHGKIWDRIGSIGFLLDGR